MATTNQNIATPRFYIDFTQLALAKGFRAMHIEPTLTNVLPTDSSQQENALTNRAFLPWEFDYNNPVNYTVLPGVQSSDEKIEFKCYPFWNMEAETEDEEVSIEWGKLMKTTNWAGIFNHNLYSRFKNTTGSFPKVEFSWRGNILNPGDDFFSYNDVSQYLSTNGPQIEYDGHTLCEFTDITVGSSQFATLAQFIVTIRSSGEDWSMFDFDLGAIAFGKYVDLPRSPDLTIKKSVQYEGATIQRTFGGSDAVQINHQGISNWVTGEPWALKNNLYGANGIVHDDTFRNKAKIGRNGRRYWEIQYSYLSDTEMFYDTAEEGVGSATNDFVPGGIVSSSDIQQVWDLTLGGALPFVFSPDPSTISQDIYERTPELAVCRFIKDSFNVKQTGINSYNTSFKIEEVW